MSALKDTVHLEEYFVLDHRNTEARRPFPFAVFRWDQGSPTLVDLFKTRSGAKHACHLLNNGLAHVDSHALFGCRVRIG